MMCCCKGTATTEIYTALHTLSLHAALPICGLSRNGPRPGRQQPAGHGPGTRSRLCPAPSVRWVTRYSARPRTISSSVARCSRTALSCRSEEHTSELQSLMRISYAAFCLKKKNITLPKILLIVHLHSH